MAEKKNPFAKLVKPVEGDVEAAEDVAAEQSEEEVVEAAKARVAAKRVVRKTASAKKAEVSEDVEETEVEPDSDAVSGDEGEPAVLASTEDDDDEVTEGDAKEEAVAESKPAVKRSRRTAAQVEQEAAEREAALQAQIDELKAAMQGKADAVDIGVVQDRVLLEDGVGGDVRVVGNGSSLANNDWRCTIDGLRVLIGRHDAQSTHQLQVPAQLVPSLVELLGELEAITA